MRSIIGFFGVLFFLYSGMLEVFSQSKTVSEVEKVKIIDEYHYSESFTDNRSYRVFLPADYEKVGPKKYPVI